ncbi:MAG: amino acid adenylation domain-containing protein, partial [Ignavibacteriae bacterium]|nr:amino acid adenylation domain-containing protein [Ignavibacteriota bacterium]
NYLLLKNLKSKLIGVLLESSTNYIASILGILKSGNSFVPIDIKYPYERINDIIKDSDISIVVTNSKYIKLINESSCDIINLDIDNKEIKLANANDPDIEIHILDLAYCIYTSGSTGVPKGVKISHLNFLTFCEAGRRIYNFSSSDNIFQFSSISFDTSIEEIFLTLTSGSALVINSEKKIADAHELIKTLSEENISVLDFPTAYWTYFSQQLYQDKLQLPKCVKKIIIGGEKANKSSLTKWNNSQSKIEFYNSYGPTETTVIASVWEFHLEKNDVIINEIPIGKAIYGYSLYVLDQSYNHLPIGAYGELFISGNAVSQGYVNKPSLTAKLFIPDPYSKIPGQRMYATGDIVKLLMDGNIEYIGRKDNQVKIRGYRVELEEISSVILQHSSVYECVILFNEITDNNKQLLAFLTVTESSSEITEKI